MLTLLEVKTPYPQLISRNDREKEIFLDELPSWEAALATIGIVPPDDRDHAQKRIVRARWISLQATSGIQQNFR